MSTLLLEILSSPHDPLGVKFKELLEIIWGSLQEKPGEA